MPQPADMPPDIADAAFVIRELEAKPVRTASEEGNLNKARLRVAYWACRRAGVVPSRESLAFIMGPSAGSLLDRYDKELEEERARRQAPQSAPSRDSARQGQFWDERKTDSRRKE